MWNIDKCWCECKNIHVFEKDYVWNAPTCICKNRKYLASIMDDSAIIRDEVRESYDEEINLNEKKAMCKIENSC